MIDKRKFYINGDWVDPVNKNDCNVIDPSTEEPYVTISLGGADDTNKAVEAAKNSFLTWKNTSKEERIELLEKLLKIYRNRSEEMTNAISKELGAPLDWASSAQMGSGESHIEDFIKRLKEFEFESNFDENSDNYIVYEPIGVCGLITPWNWPINQIALKVIPAFATGCTMILKPSEMAPLSGLLFAEMIHEAGFPAGVFNLVNGDGAGVGSQISGHPDIDMVSFTGSTRAGKLISKNAADTIKRVCLELGGKGGNIIFADAYPNAVRDGVRNIMSNAGQSCDAPTRMLVEKSIYDESIDRLRKYASEFKVDDPNKNGEHIGPVISETQFNKIQGLIQKGIDEGAKLVAGGIGKPDGLKDGYYVKPTVFADVNNEMEIARTEIFGPVLSVIPFETEEEAIKIANDTDYGLTNYIQTQDTEKVKRVARKLRSGMVDVNGAGIAVDAPFGGFKHSGIGREAGKEGLLEFLEVKSVGGWN